MARFVGTASIALALVSSPGVTQTPSATPDPQALAAARAIVGQHGDRARLEKSFNVMELVLTRQIETALDLTDPAKKDRIAGVVHSRIQAAEDDMIEARISAMAQTYTVEEMAAALAFDRSPAGQALRNSGPALSRELTATMLGQNAPAADGPPLSEQKAALIKRILDARGIDAEIRRGFRTLNTAMANAITETAKNPVPPAPATNDQAAEDAYAKGIIAVDTQFYAKTFSDEQLTAMANYFEGPAARAFVQRAPQLMSVATSAAAATFDQQLDRMDREACDAVACNATQRTALDAEFGQLRSMIARTINAMAH